MLDSLIVLYNEITPMNNPVLTTLAHTNVIFCILSRFAQCLSLPQHNEATLKTTTKFIKICASFAASDEKYRLLLLNDTLLLNHLEYGLESHITLIQDFISLKDEIKETTTESHSMCLPPIYDRSFLTLDGDAGLDTFSLTIYLRLIWSKYFDDILTIMCSRDSAILKSW